MNRRITEINYPYVIFADRTGMLIDEIDKNNISTLIGNEVDENNVLQRPQKLQHPKLEGEECSV